MAVFLGLQGMINEQIKGTDFPTATGNYLEKLKALTTETPEILANLITAAESNDDEATKEMIAEARKLSKGTPVMGLREQVVQEIILNG